MQVVIAGRASRWHVGCYGVSVMNKPALVVSLLGLCASAVAQPARNPPPAKKPNCGEHYVAGQKDSGKKSLTQAQVDEVMKTKVGEVETCWRQLPQDKRKDTSLVLQLEIDDTGEVQTIEAPGVPDETQRCIALAAVEWEFPRTDVKADAIVFTYPVALHAKG